MKRYENKEVRARIREETFGDFDRPLVVGFANRLEFDVFGGNTTERFVTTATDEVTKKSKTEFKSTLQEFGLKNVTEDGQLEQDGSQPTTFTKYSGQYEVGPMTVNDVEIPNVEKDSFTLEGGLLSVEGLLASWRQNEHIFVAGGVYPADDYIR